MISQIDKTISELRDALGATSEAELARRLKINQSTISSWKKRGKVPDKVLKVLEVGEKGQSPQPIEFGGEWQERATAIALIRFTILRQELILSGDTNEAMAVLLDLKPFWLIINRGMHEIRNKMQSLKVDIATAQALVIQEDLQDPKKTELKVKAELAEDLADNPWLKDYE